jgi:hypothetical protein
MFEHSSDLWTFQRVAILAMNLKSIRRPSNKVQPQHDNDSLNESISGQNENNLIEEDSQVIKLGGVQ